MRFHSILILHALLLCAFANECRLQAQAFRGGDVIFARDAIMVLTLGSTIQTPGLSSAGWVAAAASPRRTIIYANDTSIFEMDDASTVTPIAQGIGVQLRGLALDLDGSYVVTDRAAGTVLRISPQGSVGVIAAGFSAPWGVALRANRNIIISSADSILEIEPSTGQITTLASGPAVGVPRSLHILNDGSIVFASPSPERLGRIPASGGTPTNLSTSLCLPFAITSNFDGSYLLAQGNVSQYTLVNVSSWIEGTYTGWFGSVQALGIFVDAGGLVRLPTLSGPTLGSTGPGAIIPLDLDHQAFGNHAYTLVASTALHPGISFGSDSRSTPLQSDALFALTLAGSLAPFTSNWSGTLDAQGRALASLDISSLPPASLTGLTIYVQAAILDPNAPGGIADLTNYLPIRF